MKFYSTERVYSDMLPGRAKDGKRRGKTASDRKLLRMHKRRMRRQGKSQALYHGETES